MVDRVYIGITKSPGSDEFGVAVVEPRRERVRSVTIPVPALPPDEAVRMLRSGRVTPGAGEVLRFLDATVFGVRSYHVLVEVPSLETGTKRGQGWLQHLSRPCDRSHPVPSGGGRSRGGAASRLPTKAERGPHSR